MARAPVQIPRPLNIGAPAGSPPLIGGGPISAALMNPQPMMPQGPGMAPPQFSRRFPGPGSDPLANAPQLPAAASAMPMSAPAPGGGMGSRVGNFLGSDAALALSAGILEGGTTGQALGRGFGYALAARQAANKPQATTDDIQEYAFAKSQGYTGSFTDFMTMTRKAGATQVNVGQSAPGEKFYEELDKGAAGMFNTLYDEGRKATGTLQKVDRLESLLAKVPTGAQASMKQMAGNFGINTEGLDDIQAAQALINQLVPGQRPVGSGPMSDADLELFKQSMPRIINQPGGNTLIIQTMRGIAEYTQAQGEIAAMVQTRQITPQQGYQMLAQLPDPLAQFNEMVGAGQGGQASGEAIPPGVYDWTPEGLRPAQ